MTYYNSLGQPMPETTGASTLTTTAPNQVLTGGSDDTTFYLKHTGAQVIEQPNGGVDTEIAWVPTYLAPNVENLSVNGDYIHGVGNSLDNVITGNGRSWLYGGGGNDVLIGSSGVGSSGIATTFVVRASDPGNDVIYNWQSADQLQLTGFGFKTVGDVTAAMKQVGSDVVLQLSPSQTLTFRNISLASAQFQAKQFLLPFDSSVLGKPTLDEEFNSLNLRNASTGQGIWNTNFGGDPTNASTYSIQANGENQIYTDPNFSGTAGHNLNLNPFSINNGVLSITAGQIPQADQSSTWSYGYYSGMLNTIGSFQQKYGYFEMRAQFPNAVGTWPAFWMETTPYTRDQETDITESLGRTPDMNYVRAYGANDYQADDALKLDPNGWHTYGMLWTPSTVAFYQDGVEVFAAPAPASWTNPMSLVLNMAVGGWGGTADPSQYPASMNVDYVRAYALADGSSQVIDNTGGVGPTDPPPTTNPPPPPTNPPPVTTEGVVLQASAGVTMLNGGDGPDTLTGWAGSDVLRGGLGPDSITGGSGFNDINGNRGPDTIVGHSQIGDWLSGGQGQDSITAQASPAHNLILGNLGNDTLSAGSGGDTLRGGQGEDSIVGGPGADWISGDRGHDTVSGGGGADIFHSAPGMGVMYVTDFNPAEGDRVLVDSGGQPTPTQSGADVVVDLGGGTQVILQHTQLSSLSTGWLVVA